MRYPLIALAAVALMVGIWWRSGMWWTPAAPTVADTPPAQSSATRVATPISVTIVPAAATEPTEHTISDWREPGVDEEEANRLVGALVQRQAAGLARDLAAIVRDPRHTPRWRNYAVQHLSDLLRTTADADGRSALEWAASASEVLVREAGVFGLARLSADGAAGFDAPARRAIASALVAGTPDLVRVSAIRSLVLLHRTDENERLLRFVQDPGEAPAVRVAAVDALGDLGDAGVAKALHDVQVRVEPKRDGEVFIAALERSCRQLQGTP